MNVKIGDFFYGPEGRAAVNRMMDANLVSEGASCQEFARRFASYIRTGHCVLANSGTSAGTLIFQALKYHSETPMREGSAVLTSPLTYIASVNAFASIGFRPAFCDIRLDTFGLDEEKVKEHFEDNDPAGYSAIQPVHLMGYAVEMDKINSIAKRHGLLAVEDSCEATGTVFGGKPTGAWGTAGWFSFYIAHNIQVGEFGALTTDDAELADRANRLKGNGRLCYCPVSDVESGRCPHAGMEFNPRYLHDMVGFNFKPMEFQAVLGLGQLKKAEWIKKVRGENVKALNDGLARLEGELRLPAYSPDVSYLGYPLIVESKGVGRARLAKFLQSAGIETRPIFNCIPTQQEAYANLAKEYEGKLPNAEYVGERGLYLPVHQYLKEGELEHMVKSVAAAFRL
jgi:CDP-6-deoxy-D-xylo-4-hexulose-3-dehydrase